MTKIEFIKCCPVCGCRYIIPELHFCIDCEITCHKLNTLLREKHDCTKIEGLKQPYNNGLIIYISQYSIEYYMKGAKEKYNNENQYFKYFVETELSKLPTYNSCKLKSSEKKQLERDMISAYIQKIEARRKLSESINPPKDIDDGRPSPVDNINAECMVDYYNFDDEILYDFETNKRNELLLSEDDS